MSNLNKNYMQIFLMLLIGLAMGCSSHLESPRKVYILSTGEIALCRYSGLSNCGMILQDCVDIKLRPSKYLCQINVKRLINE